jgi:hypothetical protein
MVWSEIRVAGSDLFVMETPSFRPAAGYFPLEGLIPQQDGG